MSRFSWVVLTLATLFFWQAVPIIFSHVIPFDWWMDIRRIEVTDAVAGDEIYVTVDRDIWRNFDGRYRVDVRRVTADGAESYCTRSDAVPYRRDAAYGSDRTLRWFMGIPPNPPCSPLQYHEPGSFYLIVDYWIPIMGGIVTLHEQHQSNTFTIFPAGERGEG
jgi:hypothetical protein